MAQSTPSAAPAPAAAPVPPASPVLPGTPTDAIQARLLAEEIRVGLDRMRHMSHDELRSLIQSRIAMLDGVLKEREQRHEAIQTARLAAGVLEIRREHAHSIQRHVNAWSAVAAALCFGFVLAHM
jgi:hypothetical protein